jgi:hypothetical protein
MLLCACIHIERKPHDLAACCLKRKDVNMRHEYCPPFMASVDREGNFELLCKKDTPFLEMRDSAKRFVIYRFPDIEGSWCDVFIRNTQKGASHDD